MNMNLTVSQRNLGNVASHDFNTSISNKNDTLFGPATLQERVIIGVRLAIDVSGAVINLLLLTACRRQQKNRRSAVGALIMLLVSLWTFYSVIFFPITDIMRVLNLAGYNIGEDYCVGMMITSAFIGQTCSWTDTCLAINRIMAICFPWRYKTFSSRRVLTFMSFSAFFLAFLGIILPANGIGGYYTVVGANSCNYIPTSRLGRILNPVIMFVPNSLVGLCSLAVLTKVVLINRDFRKRFGNKVGSRRMTDAQTRQMKTLQRRISVASMLLASFLFAVVGTLPYYVITLTAPWILGRYPSINVWLSLLYRAEYAVCPLIMILRSSDYLNIIKNMLSFGGSNNLESISSTCANKNTSVMSRQLTARIEQPQSETPL